MFTTPFNLGPFTVDGKGQISPRTDDQTPGFSFCWAGRTMQARMLPNGADRVSLFLKTCLGRIPSTAAGGSDSRLQTFRLVQAIPRTLPEGWRLKLLPDHQFRLEIEMLIERATTATALLTQLTCFLLALSPYLDVLDEAGVTQDRD